MARETFPFPDERIPFEVKQTLRPLFKRVFKTLAKHAPGSSVRIGLLRACGFRIGESVYLGEDIIVAEILEDGSEKLVLGDRVAVGPRVTFVTSSDPNKSRISPKYVTPLRGRIVVGNDAWIGEQAVVGAGAVVTKDVPRMAVVAGVPARILRFLDDTDKPLGVSLDI